ncbi:DUF4862 family protein [Rahnella woolbedingensis]|uniref:DUF4862 family protein n=1 Tax=Rahnella woolbedingensis TaxID=1510574 RepID=A0A419N600_9GAMM|nr:DUF4862 family protein [Rahnella woolbedingensis]RJT42188.1 DUF4862 family protein [Rahnella woolbedingensis]
MQKHAGFIVGAYPCAPSFHQRNENEETEFWRKLTDIPDIRAIEQPCLEELHPFGDDWLFRHLPQEWDIVVTGVMETMRRRGTQPGFGLASEHQEQRRACIHYYRHLFEKVSRANERAGRKKILAVELQSAPLAGTRDVDLATRCFTESLTEILRWDWPCELTIEHCDALDKPAARKGFLPLESELTAIAQAQTQTGKTLGVCINWARSAIEGRNTRLPLQHLQRCQQAGVLSALMFSGTASGGAYGEWQDLHAPFAPFPTSEAGCVESLMTVETVAEMFEQAPADSLSFTGIKLLEIEASANVDHRISILKDGINAMNLAIRKK